MNDWVEYDGVRYPLRTFNVQHPTEGWGGCYTCASDKLMDALQIESDDDRDEATSVDNLIYHYIDDACFNLPAKEICEKHLDMTFNLIEEIL